jgi:4-hydroxybenzoate polyprenyltransferase
MKVLPAFLRLIRFPNLIYIALTQCLYQYCVVMPIFDKAALPPVFNTAYFALISFSSILIAAGGYIINDYFDVNIDLINKPERTIIEKIIKRRQAILLHLLLSLLGIVIGLYVGYKMNNIFIGLSNIACAVVLWFYSTTFKRKLLIGNVLISLLTAWTVFFIAFIHLSNLFFTTPGSYSMVDSSRLFRISVMYTAFAFIISLIREVVKDLEDMEGDRRYGCKTIPIVWGVPAAKIFIAVWMVVLVAMLSVVQFYVLQFGWWISAGYVVTLVILPLIWLFRKLYHAAQPADYHGISTAIKVIMFTGILSMLFFRIYS